LTVGATSDDAWHRRRLKVLLTEGSSTSARQAIYALAPLRPVLEACDPNPHFCIARASWFVRTCHRCPPFAADPAGFYRALLDRLRATRYDVLLPVHDQVFLAARFRATLAGLVGLAVPEFDAVVQVQSKVAFTRLLDALALPQPAWRIARRRDELAGLETPCYLKLAYGTAGRGVWHVRDPAEAAAVIGRLDADGLLTGGREILVQQPAAGTLCVVQSVFQHGRLVAAHTYQARGLGVGGSAWARVGVAHPAALAHLARLGAHLRWHGALMLDYLYDDATGRVAFIEANPRLGETFNATRSGVNLAARLVEVSLGCDVPTRPPGRVGVRTHSVLNRLLALGQAGATRSQLLAELADARAGRGIYKDSADDVTRPRDDPPSVIPVVVTLAQLLRDPHKADRIVRRAVNDYGLTEATVRAIEQMPADPAA
jgi:biotin carboxylase